MLCITIPLTFSKDFTLSFVYVFSYIINLFLLTKLFLFSSVQSLSHVQLIATPWTAAHQASLSIIISRSLLKFMSIESVHDAIQPSHPLSPPSAPAFNLSQHRAFSNESVLHIRWPKYWRFSFSMNPSNEYSGLISFKIDWFDLLAVQGTLKSLIQHHSSKTSILWCPGFFIVQFSLAYSYLFDLSSSSKNGGKACQS